jgi:hypothetical protein
MIFARFSDRQKRRSSTFVVQQVQQHTGVPPIIMQQVQPAFMQAITQSQQPWIMSQQPLSPLVQVMIQPSLVISHLHMPIVMLQQQTIIPFIMQQKVHIPPAIMVQRFCIMAQLAGSVQVQVTFMPPVHFSIFMVQRGTMTIFGDIGVAVPGIIGLVPIPVIPFIGRSIIIVPVMIVAPSVTVSGSRSTNTNRSLSRPSQGPRKSGKFPEELAFPPGGG